MKNAASALLIAIAAFGAAAANAAPVNNETGNTTFGLSQAATSVSRAQVVSELQGAKAPANEIGQTVFFDGASNVTRAQVQKDIAQSQTNAGINSVYFGA